VPWWLATLLFAVALYVVLLGGLAAAGRGADAAAVARLVPDLLVLVRRLAADPRLPRGLRATLALLVLYLASPIDLVPDFIPVIGVLDDVLLVVLVLRWVLRAAGPALVTEHWPGPPRGLELLLGTLTARSSGR